MTGRLAKRYARAVFELARDEGTLEALGEELGRGVATFEDPRVGLLLLSPVIDAGVRLRTTKEVAAALGLSPIVANLIALLAERNRLPILPDVARWWLDKVFPFERQIMAAARPIVRSVLDVPMPGSAVIEDVRGLVGNLIAMNEILRDHERVSVRLVMNPDRMVVDEARRTFTDVFAGAGAALPSSFSAIGA